MLDISVTNARQRQHVEHSSGPLEFGRGPQRQLPRCVIDDVFVSRDQFVLQELPGGRVRLDNLSVKIALALPDGSQIPAGGSMELDLPLRVQVGDTVIEVRPHQEAAGAPLSADGYRSLKPVRGPESLRAGHSLGKLDAAPAPETLTQWMETVLALQRLDVSPAEFYAQTAEALVRLVGLDVGLVLLHDGKDWRVVARAADEDGDDGTAGREFSQTVLREVMARKQTFYQDIGLMQGMESLRNVDAVVVSPLFGLGDEVVGALYGLRRGRGVGGMVRPLEAQLVQLLAAAAGANLARTAATRTRTRFEQFFSPELVRELERDPGLLEGRGLEITALMSDLRGFSTVSERLGPQQTCRLVRDVMECLSARVVEHGGVIVSYLGDGLLAMWNAPARQEDHAARACRAALAMLGELPGLNRTWEPVLGHALGVGVGINTGPAQVGNIGSSRKFMYGPLGNTVNLASRVEGATKHLGVPLLVTGPTRARLGDQFATRRLGKVRVVGIQEAVDLYELREAAVPAPWRAYRDAYEAALALYEGGQWLQTCQTLLPLLEQSGDGGHDQATLKLMKRSWSCLEAPPEEFEPTLDLGSK